MIDIKGISNELKSKLEMECRIKASSDRAKEIIIARKYKSRVDAEELRDRIRLKNDIEDYYTLDY